LLFKTGVVGGQAVRTDAVYYCQFTALSHDLIQMLIYSDGTVLYQSFHLTVTCLQPTVVVLIAVFTVVVVVVLESTQYPDTYYS